MIELAFSWRLWRCFQKITITNINAKVQEDTKNVSINLVVDIRDISQLDFVMTKLRRIREVYTVQRSKGGA